MDIVEEGLNDEFLYKMLTDAEKRMDIPVGNLGIKERLQACKKFLNNDPYLTMFVLYLRVGPYNLVTPYTICPEAAVVVQDTIHKYTRAPELGRYTGIKRRASYQGLTVFMQKVAKANDLKHMFVKDMYKAIVDHFATKPKEKSDPINAFLNTNILDDEWCTSSNQKVVEQIAMKLGQGWWSSFFDTYMHYSLLYSGDVITKQGNKPTGRRQTEKLSQMNNTLNVKMKLTEQLEPVKEFLFDCEGCTETVDDPLVDKIMEHSGLKNANVINAFRKQLHETTEGFMMFDDMRKNLEAWSHYISTPRGDDRTFAQDVAYRVWTMRYWDDTGYHYG